MKNIQSSHTSASARAYFGITVAADFCFAVGQQKQYGMILAKEIMDETAYLMSSDINSERINNALKSDTGSVVYKSLEELKRAYKA
ncbi:MAG: hypothetical protein EBS06_08630 [Proteobacteria bacterium]|nr:hypothetical protein [Pseudomonadota bacterium]